MGKEAGPKQGRGARRRGEGTRVRPYPTSHPPTAGKPPFGGQAGLPRATSPPDSRKTLQPTHVQTHRISLPHLTVTQGPLPFPPISHSQIDGRRQAAHPTREESVMAGSMQVPPMAMCGIDGFERPPTPLPIGACTCFGFERSNPKQVHVLFEGVKGGRTIPHQLHSQGKHFPVRGVQGTSRRVQPPRNRKTIPE